MKNKYMDTNSYVHVGKIKMYYTLARTCLYLPHSGGLVRGEGPSNTASGTSLPWGSFTLYSGNHILYFLVEII